MEEIDFSSFKVVSADSFKVQLKEIDLPSVEFLDDTSKVSEIMSIMQEKKFGSIVFAKNNKITGIITERDFLLKDVFEIEENKNKEVSEFMTRDPFTLTLESTVLDCIKAIDRYEFRHIPVVNGAGTPTHMVSIKDVLSFIVDFFSAQVKGFGTKFVWEVFEVDPLSENFSFDSLDNDDEKLSGAVFITQIHRAVRRPVRKIDVNCSLQEVLGILKESKAGSVVITEFESKIIGIITERDFLLKIFGKIDLTKGPVPIAPYMTNGPDCLLTRHLLVYGINNMFSKKYRNIIIVNDDRYPVAILTLLDIFKHLSRFLFKKDKEVLPSQK